jgi:hypothetical protein
MNRLELPTDMPDSLEARIVTCENDVSCIEGNLGLCFATEESKAPPSHSCEALDFVQDLTIRVATLHTRLAQIGAATVKLRQLLSGG